MLISREGRSALSATCVSFVLRNGSDIMVLEKCDVCGIFKQLEKVGKRKLCQKCSHDAAVKKQACECEAVRGEHYAY